ncbi:MAG: T9SS type A sorting domain-containing protein, partial [Bacteroidota bacterium]
YRYANGAVTLLAEFANGAQGSDPQQLVEFRDAVYLTAKDLFNDWSWWQYTGSSFFRVKADFYAGSGIAFNKQLVFVTNTDSTGTELWRWDPRPPVSTDERTAPSAALTIFPNPAHGTFQLNLASPLERGSMTVLDIMGRPVQQLGLSRQTRWPLTVDLNGQPAGTYVVLVRTEDRVISHRLVLAR